jgi:hypothetical protein
MKTLILVPVIHMSSDMGSLAKDLNKRGIADLGEELWKDHIKTVETFWDELSNFFDAMHVSGMKIYQDGMIAEGEVGQMIVREGAKSGSKNYELVSKLLKRGAILVKTEDFKLVKKERDSLIAITQAKSLTKKLIAFMKYKVTKNILLNKRDKFIAGRVGETLKLVETGIIFIGAYHNIKDRLPKDIKIMEIKNTEKVREYQKLIPFYDKNRERIEELGRYLISKIYL